MDTDDLSLRSGDNNCCLACVGYLRSRPIIHAGRLLRNYLPETHVINFDSVVQLKYCRLVWFLRVLYVYNNMLHKTNDNTRQCYSADGYALWFKVKRGLWTGPDWTAPMLASKPGLLPPPYAIARVDN